MAVPVRYRDYFQDFRVGYPNGTWEMCWRCRQCQQVIKRNAAGAQSHLAKHLRAVLAKAGGVQARSLKGV